MELFGNCEAHPFGINKEPWIDYYCDACYEPYTSIEGWGTGQKSQRCSELIPGENESLPSIWTSKIIEHLYSDGSGNPGSYCAWYASFNTGRIDDKCGGDYGEVSWSGVRCVHPL